MPPLVISSLRRWCLPGLLLGSLTAAPLERDLGAGLHYVRSAALPADLPAAATPTQPLVLDLRFASTEPGAATALAAWLKFRASPARPVFVLINQQTAPDLRAIFGPPPPAAGVLTIGVPAQDFVVDVAVSTSPAADRAAYDALPHAATADPLLIEHAGKPRVDEASIMRDRTHPPDDPLDDVDEFASKTGDGATATAAAEPSPPVIDRSLQRAVQLHRGWLALKRLK